MDSSTPLPEPLDTTTHIPEQEKGGAAPACAAEADTDPAPQLAPIVQDRQRRKRDAIIALRRGQSLAQAAEAAGVDPSTLFRWRQRDPRFAAVYETWRKEAEQTTRERMVAAGDCAVDTVLAACRGGDLRASLVVIKSLSALLSRRPGAQISLNIGGGADSAAPASAADSPAGRLALVQRLVDEMDLDPATRSAYRAAFTLHHTLLQSRGLAPIDAEAQAPAQPAPQPQGTTVRSAPVELPAPSPGRMHKIVITDAGHDAMRVGHVLWQAWGMKKVPNLQQLRCPPYHVDGTFDAATTADMLSQLRALGASVEFSEAEGAIP